MAEDKEGFAVHVGELEKVATEYLPQVSIGLQTITHIIPESIQGGGAFEAMTAMTGALDDYTGAVGRRQATGCGRIHETAEALLDIVRLYRRADGQA